MNKKVFIAVLLVGFLVGASRAQAWIVVPFFNINIHEHTVGADGTFNFHLIESNPPDWISSTVDDFSIDTVNGAGLYSTGSTSGNSTRFSLTQDQVAGWQNYTIACVSSNPLVTADQVPGGVLIHGQPYSSVDCDITNVVKQSCISNCNSNVFFLPGIEASRLYRPDYNGGTNQLWEPSGDGGAKDLFLNDQGKGLREDIYTKDVIDEAYAPVVGPNIYKSFIAQMDDLKNNKKLINDWRAAPYDWRLSLDDILSSGNQFPDGRIYYSGPLAATSTPYIIQELNQLAATSRTGKVTIVAHSNGGLVAKALIQQLGTTTTVALVDRVIMVDVPQAGTPEAVGALLHGEDQAIPFKVSNNVMRALGNHSPAAYNLLPSSNYFTYVDDPVVTFDSATMPDWVQKYGDVVHSKERLHKFLTDSYDRVNADSANTQNAAQLNDTMLAKAENLHDRLDGWAPPSGVKVIQIAGWGIPTTVKGIDYSMPSGMLTLTASTTIDGDGTVVTPSELWMSAITPGVENYWVDLKRYNNDHWFSTLGGLLEIKHKNILEIENLRNYISDTITGNIKSLLDYTYLSASAPSSTDHRLRYELHSPLTLDMYDEQGRHTGIATPTGELEQQIPGTYYMKYGDVKYLFTDTSIPTHVVMNGYATSTFTFKVEELQGDTPIARTTFQDVPVTPTTKVVIGTASGISALSSMRIDKNGDGIIDASITPKIGGTAYLDVTPPEALISLSTSTQRLLIEGVDDTQTTISATATSTLITDQGGNTLQIVHPNNSREEKKEIKFEVRGLSYNGVSTGKIPKTVLQYEWSTDKAGNIKELEESVIVGTQKIEGHYNTRKNVTEIKKSLKERRDQHHGEDDDNNNKSSKETFPGLVVIRMTTEKGKVNVSY